MREHKYKAYHKEKKVIRDVVYIDFENKWVGVNYNNNQVAWNFWDIELMEYTGLKDKNGVEIYEGYIVKACSEGYKHIGAVQKRIDGLYIIYPAYGNQKMWGLCPNSNGDTTVEVIGNIYQDKHLLEG